MVKIANFKKNPNWNMPNTPSKMHLYDIIMKIDTIVFEIVGGGGGGAILISLPRIVSFKKMTIFSDF